MNNWGEPLKKSGMRRSAQLRNRLLPLDLAAIDGGGGLCYIAPYENIYLQFGHGVRRQYGFCGDTLYCKS